MKKRVEVAFQGYLASVYPGQTLGPEQLAECRNAFFAGVHWMQVKLPESLDVGDEPTDADMAVMKEVDAEDAARRASLTAQADDDFPF